jgi:hypothetical protein
MKDPAEGSATVTSYQAFTTPGMENNARPGFEVTLHAQVVVQADGLEPTAVEFITNFPQSELPLESGAVLPVTVDRKNPEHLKLNPSFVKQAKIDAEARLAQVARTSSDQAQQVAAAMRAGEMSSPVAPNPHPGASGQAGSVVNVFGADSPEAKAALAQVREALGSADGTAGTREQQSDDPIAKLERLAKLRDSGVVSDVEFEQQKQRILGSS